MKIDVAEFERMAQRTRDSGVFYGQCLERLVSDTGANAGVIWNCSDRPFHPIVQHSNGEATPVRLSKKDHDEIFEKVLKQQRSAVIRANREPQPGPTPYIVLAPVKGIYHGMIELVLPGGGAPEQDKQLLLMLDRVCDVISDWEQAELDGDSDSSMNAGVAVSGPSLDQFSQFVHSLHKSIDRGLTCSNIANETRRLLSCDRVSVVLWHRGGYKLFAVSGQPSVNRRSNTVHLLEKIAKRVLKTENSFWYPDEGEIAPQIKTVLDEYLSISATRSLVIHPVRAKVTELVEDPESNERKHNPIIGGVIYEHCNEQWSPDEVAPTLDFVTQHVGDALRNAKKHHDLFLYPVWNLLGKSRVLAAPRVLPKTLLALAAIVLTLLVLTFWRVPFYVSAKGVIVPQQRQWVFPKTQGDVVSVEVDHGDYVTRDQMLVQLKSEELRMRMEEVAGRIQTLEQRKKVIERTKFKTSGIPGQDANSENINSLIAEIESLQKQREWLTQMEAKLQVKSPMQGQVITWDVRQKLEGRTLQPQQLLMEIANPDGPWQLELDVEDRRVGHLLRAWEQSSEGRLKVKFSLAADPNRTYEGEIVEVSNAMRLDHDNKQMMRVRVEIDEEAIALKQAKTGVSAKIYCGYHTSIGYLWLHDIPESLRRYVFFYFEG